MGPWRPPKSTGAPPPGSELQTPAQPPAGTPMFTVEFTRGADGTFTCETFENLGGE